MKKKIVKGIACSLLSIMLLATGCGVAGNTLDITVLQNAAGEFQFQSLTWDCSTADAERLLNCSLEPLGNSGSFDIFMVDDYVEYNGCIGDLHLEFHNDNLKSACILFSEETAQEEQFLADLKEQLFTEYGTVEVSIQNSSSEELNITTESENYLWEAMSKHTVLSLSKFSTNDQFKYIKLAVYLAPDSE